MRHFVGTSGHPSPDPRTLEEDDFSGLCPHKEDKHRRVDSPRPHPAHSNGGRNKMGADHPEVQGEVQGILYKVKLRSEALKKCLSYLTIGGSLCMMGEDFDLRLTQAV